MSSHIKTLTTCFPTDVQVYIVSPHQFLIEQQPQLLPDWDLPVTAIVLVLQRSTISLQKCNDETQSEKQRCRHQFIRWGCHLISILQEQGYCSELFDPRTGYPWYSSRGILSFDDNAAVQALLNFPLHRYQNCSLLQHPIWKHNIYPGTIVTSAPLDVVKFWSEKQLIDCH